MPRRVIGSLPLLLSLAIADVARAQEPSRTVAVSLSYGVSQFDLSGTQTDVTMSVAAGLRGWITERFGARAARRVRGFGWRFTGSAAEWTGGLALRL